MMLFLTSVANFDVCSASVSVDGSFGPHNLSTVNWESVVLSCKCCEVQIRLDVVFASRKYYEMGSLTTFCFSDPIETPNFCVIVLEFVHAASMTVKFLLRGLISN